MTGIENLAERGTELNLIIRIYFISITLVGVLCLVFGLVSAIETFNVIRFVIIGLVAIGSAGFGWLSDRTLRSDGLLIRYSIRLDRLYRKAAKFQSGIDISLLAAILIGWLVFARFWRYGFLEFIWLRFPGYTATLLPLLIWIGYILLMTSFHLKISGVILSGHNLRDWLSKQVSLYGIALLIFIFTVGIYWGSASLVGQTFTPSYSYFPELAEAFQSGELFISSHKLTKDLTLVNGRYFVSFPPLGALLMFPKIASSSRFGINTVNFTIMYAALSPAVIFLVLNKLRDKGWLSLGGRGTLWVVALFSVGTAQYYMSTTGVIVHTAQILAATFLSLSILASLSWDEGNSWSLVRSATLGGLALGMAMLSRPHIGFGWIFLLGIIAQSLTADGRIKWKQWLLWGVISALPMSLILAGMGWYNLARFGAVTDFGYGSMLVADHLVAPLQTYGQFHPHYIWQNLKANWFGLPSWHSECRRLAPSRAGMSIFITTPAIVLIYRGWKKKLWLIGGWVAVTAIILVHLFYYNTGGHQFGYRFSLDFLVMAFCLLAAGFKDRLPKIFPYLVAYSAVINFIGVLWNAKQWCITW